ncbi:hypothetical protein A0J61_09931 [Choanephora cucurbitarum]|uniref:DUF962 domain-containing protein n=1 Tax=Choanephora cucurbitarum TaxID=101091 RepID=A0A1C7N054_9FUNG|nr:hypothetical protein A0J61_09931 [Choanephora cucurbitarum]
MSSQKVVNHNYSKRSEPTEGFKTLESFYPFYLGEHCNRTNRRLHVLGTSISILLFILAIKQLKPKLVLAGIVQVFFYLQKQLRGREINKNSRNSKPATFRYPIWSFICDLRMWKEIVSAQRAF